MTPRYRLSRMLRPRPGRRLPRELRPRHVGRLAQALPAGLSDPAFGELLSCIDDGGPIHRGNRVTLFFEGEAAVEAMLEAAREAERQILLESYIFHHDETGRRFLEVLGRSAQRGVAVYVLADAFGSWRTRASFWREMREQGIRVRLFHRLLRHLWWHPFRDHRKIVVVDRRVAFTGGMNIGNEYAGSRRRRGDGWRDTHLRVEGPAAAEMAAVFSEGWERMGGDRLEPWPKLASHGDGTEILVLDSRPARGHLESAAVFAAVIAAARRSVWVTNAYFAPGNLALSALEDAADRGVDVRLLLPGISDLPIIRRAGRGSYDELLEHGVRVFEYQPAVLHAKSLVADGVVSIVGSTNLDFRSFRFNAECNLVMIDPVVGETLARAFEADLEQSREMTLDAWRRRPLADRAIEALARLLSPLL